MGKSHEPIRSNHRLNLDQICTTRTGTNNQIQNEKTKKHPDQKEKSHGVNDQRQDQRKTQRNGMDSGDPKTAKQLPARRSLAPSANEEWREEKLLGNRRKWNGGRTRAQSWQ